MPRTDHPGRIGTLNAKLAENGELVRWVPKSIELQMGCLLMKLRIKGNSIRLRLLRSEVERFATDGRVSDEIQFGPNKLQYSMLMSTEADAIHATFEANEIMVLVPEKTARDWATTDDIGIESEQPIGEVEALSILVEKDFVCIGRPDDPDRDDAFCYPVQSAP